jgi:hypothetical protein
MNVSPTDGDQLAGYKESRRGRISQCGSGTGRRVGQPSGEPYEARRRAATIRPQARRNAALRVHIYSSAPDYLTLIRMLMHGGAGYVKAG